METQATNKDEDVIKELDELEFLSLKIPSLIPVELVELVKGRTFSVEQFYKYQAMQIKNENPSNFLYALISKDKVIHGFLWCEINSLDGSLFVNTFSISKKFWHKGKVLPKVIEFLKVFKKKIGATRCFWISTNEKFFIKQGFKRSKNVLMEYNLD